MASLRYACAVGATALTIGAGASAVPGTVLARDGGRGFHDAIASGWFGRGGLYVGHYDDDGWGLDRALEAAGYYESCHYGVYGWSGDCGFYSHGDYSVFPFGSW
jgi:hypothetical protein